MKKDRFDITGMSCAACSANITRTVKKINGVKEVAVNLISNSMTVEYDENVVNADGIIQSVIKIGYGASLFGSAEKRDKQTEKRGGKNNKEEIKRLIRRFISSVCLLVPLMYIAMGQMIGLPLPYFFKGKYAIISAFTQLLLTLPVIIINGKFFKSGFKGVIKGMPNMDTLVSLGSGVSLIYGIYIIFRMAVALINGEAAGHYSHMLYFESSAMILTLVTLGKMLEAISKGKTTSALDKLIDLAPKKATVIRDGKEVIISAEELVLGDIIKIRPGERLPADGEITEGGGFIDQSAVTGESLPVEKKVGDKVISATVNKNGSFLFKATAVGENTSLAGIIRMVEEAGNSKAPIAKLADKISGIFVPTVLFIALITLIVWLSVGYSAEFAINCSVAVLVISCPCALGLATPVAVMAGTGKAAEFGILVKSAESMQKLSGTNTVVFDKTGTVTEGKPVVTDILPFGTITENELLSIASGLEQGSEHPLAVAVIKYAEETGIKGESFEDFAAVGGKGVRGRLNNRDYYAGNFQFIKENGIPVDVSVEKTLEELASKGKTPLIFAGSVILGIIAVADKVKKSSIEAVEKFKKLGYTTIMLTGDNEITANAVKEEVGVDEVIAGVLPDGKEKYIKKLQDEGRKVVMVGDGINDAPALARADVGIAIGRGTDIAIDSADIVLINSKLTDAVTAVRLSKSVMRNIKMNLFWAFFYNVLGIPLAAGVFYPLTKWLLSPMIGSAAMSVSSLFVVGNALRLRFFKSKKDKEEIKIPEISGENKGDKKMEKTIKIEGMMCNHCKMAVEKAILGVEGVLSVEVSLEKKQAKVVLKEGADCTKVKDAVVEAGYEVVCPCE